LPQEFSVHVLDRSRDQKTESVVPVDTMTVLYDLIGVDHEAAIYVARPEPTRSAGRRG